MMFQRLTLTIIALAISHPFINGNAEDESFAQNETNSEISTNPTSTNILLTERIKTISNSEKLFLAFQKYFEIALAKKKIMQSKNITNTTNSTGSLNKTLIMPPEDIFREYLRCLQLKSLNGLPTQYSCPYEYEEDIRICWKATENGSSASAVIKYDHGINNFYDGARHGVENCTIEKYCLPNGTWAMTIPPDLQCRTCVGDGRPVKFDSISIMIETMSLSISLLSLTIAVLCMISVKRLHLPRNLLHMHLFVAFILRSVVKLIFIHLIIGGYPRSMITYTRDECGNIEILSKSSLFIHVFGCRMLSSLFWYTDAVSQTFIFCEAMFLFTALTSHLFRDRGCLLFVLWGWCSPLVWLTMWIASHLITDQLKRRTTCWLEADNTTYFYYFFYVPYAFYLLVNFGIFLFLVRLLYTKYQSNNVQTNRSGNRHLIRSIVILIPLFGLHSLFVIWVFYRKNEARTAWYYISVTFKAVFGDLQGFFTSLIYFYFNTEIRQEVLRQIQRSLLSSDAVRRSSAGETLTTRLSVFRISVSHQRQSAGQQRFNRPTRLNKPRPSQSQIHSNPVCWKRFLICLCPCLLTMSWNDPPYPEAPTRRRRQADSSPMSNTALSNRIPNVIVEDETGAVTTPLLTVPKSPQQTIEGEDLTCDTMLMKHENESDELLSDANDVTFHQTSFTADQASINSTHTPLLPVRIHRLRSKSDGNNGDETTTNIFADNKSLR